MEVSASKQTIIKESCIKFFTGLIKLASGKSMQIQRNVHNLIQQLINANVEPEVFCVQMGSLLNANLQENLIRFLKMSLPVLRNALFKKEITIHGIEPPPQHVIPILQRLPPRPVEKLLPGQNVNVVQGQEQLVKRPLSVPKFASAPSNLPTVVALRPNKNSYLLGTPVAPMKSLQPPPPVNKNVSGIIAPTNELNVKDKQFRSNIKISSIVRQQPTYLAPKQLGISYGNKICGAKTSISSAENGNSSKSIFSNADCAGDDMMNDVVVMSGIDVGLETQKIVSFSEKIPERDSLTSEESFLNLSVLRLRLRTKMNVHGLENIGDNVAELLSIACQQHLKNVIEQLIVITDHRTDNLKFNARFEATKDVRGQIKFLEDVDRAEQKRHKEVERELLLRAAKSKSKPEDPEQAKIKAKARELQRAEIEEMRQRDANMTALHAIGPRKKIKFDADDAMGGGGTFNPLGNHSAVLTKSLPRTKRITLPDILFFMEQSNNFRRGGSLYEAYLK